MLVKLHNTTLLKALFETLQKSGTSQNLFPIEPIFERTPRYLTHSLGFAEGKTWNTRNIEGLRALLVKFIAAVIYIVFLS